MNAGTVPTDRPLLNQSFLYSSFTFIFPPHSKLAASAFETGNARINHSELKICSTFT